MLFSLVNSKREDCSEVFVLDRKMDVAFVQRIVIKERVFIVKKRRLFFPSTVSLLSHDVIIIIIL